jgi:acetyl esterase/lipase
MIRMLVGCVVVASIASACSSSPRADLPTPPPITQPTPITKEDAPMTTIAYGPDSSQFGQLWMPAAAAGPMPVVVLIHGGFWRAEYGLDLMNGLAADLAGRGYAAWNIEYRRVGDGGGYPETLDDVAAAIDALSTIAPDHGLDLTNVVFVGHSAGGHLALWAAGRSALPAGSPGADPLVVPRLAIGQGPVVDLIDGDRLGLGGGAVTAFMGGTAPDHPDRYAIATPSIVAGVEYAVVRGSQDQIVPAQFTLPMGADPLHPPGISVVDVDGADHFALIDSTSTAWQAVISLITG